MYTKTDEMGKPECIMVYLNVLSNYNKKSSTEQKSFFTLAQSEFLLG